MIIEYDTEDRCKMCIRDRIDRYRKDRTLGRIRRVVASVAPRTNPKGKPMLGKMDAEAHRKLEKMCIRDRSSSACALAAPWSKR